MKGLPKRLQDRPNDFTLILDKYNVAHDRRQGARASCGALGTVVTLAQAIAWGTSWCGHASCYSLSTRNRTAR